MKNLKKPPEYFILDVDGVITDGQMIYDKNGKKFKTFGPDDTDALKVLKQFIKIHFVSGDKKGFSISKKRVTDMGFKISFVPALERDKWIDMSSVLEKTKKQVIINRRFPMSSQNWKRPYFKHNQKK